MEGATPALKIRHRATSIMRFEEIKLIAITNNDFIKKSDAIILLEGDGYNRIDQAVRIFKSGLAKKIIISGGNIDNPPFTIPAKLLAEKVYKAKIPKNKVVIEEKSQNTYEQGSEVMKIVKKEKWKKIILVASHFHQPRAFLTFLKAMKKCGLKIQIFNSPARGLSWFKKNSLGLNRLQMLENEFEKIAKYGKKGELVSISEAISYQNWKEKQK